MNVVEAETGTLGAIATLSKIPIRNMWHMLLYAWNETPLSVPEFEAVDRAPSLDALLASILAHLIHQRLRIGLGRNYTDVERFIRGVRGRIDFNESLKKLSFHKSQVFCRFQHYDANVPKNQIIRSMLVRLVQIGEFGPDRALGDLLRGRLRRLIRNLEGVDLIDLDLAVIHRQQFGRNDRDYRLMLAICELLLQRQMPTEVQDRHRLPGLDRDMLTLHRVYERFVANFYRLCLRDWHVERQAPLSWHATQSSDFLPIMVPDLIFRHKVLGHVTVLDTKFTPNSLAVGRGTRQVFDSSHLYQIYAYLRSQESLSEHHQEAAGILLYPAAQYKLSEVVELQGHKVRFETIDLAQPWTQIETDLLALMSTPSVGK